MTEALILIPEITKGMKSIGSKSLLKIREGLVIDHQIDFLFSLNKTMTINIVTGFEHEKVIKHLADKFSKKIDQFNIIFNPSYEQTNHGESLRLLIKNKHIDDLLILNNGILIKKNAFSNKTLTGKSKIYLLDKDKNNFNIGCHDSIDNIEYLFYDLPSKWSECVYLNNKSVDRIKRIVGENAPIEHMYLFEILNTIMGTDSQEFEKVYLKKTQVFNVLGVRDLNKAKQFI